MALDERARHQLYLRLEEQLGDEAASTLMEHLPPTGWGDVATKGDLDHLAAATKRDLDHLATATKRDLDHLREVTSADIRGMGDQLRAEFHKSIATQTITIVFATMASNAAAVFAVAQLR